jgi:hypothetical protein
MAGLDPAIQVATLDEDLRSAPHQFLRRNNLDGRVKPGHDDAEWVISKTECSSAFAERVFTKKEGTAKSRPFLTNRSDAAIYPGEVSAPELGGQLFAAAHEQTLPHPGPRRLATHQSARAPSPPPPIRQAKAPDRGAARGLRRGRTLAGQLRRLPMRNSSCWNKLMKSR